MKKHLHLFEGYGIELEYMIVDKENLSIKPIADKVIYEVAKKFVADVELNGIEWSNELVLHVIELKTNGPAKDLVPLSKMFHDNVTHINKILDKYDAKLLPTGAHPLMDPYSETYLWPHEYNPVYEAYNKIFDCRGHGWSNLQSLHLNYPFANDDEFGKLHAAIRLILPILPAITASTPILDGRNTELLDARLECYRTNQNKIPSITGILIPERVYKKKEYNEIIFKKIYKDILPYDPKKFLRYEWLNSRGAIARYDRYTIEIRTIDIQESPAADLAIVELISILLKNLIDEKWTSTESQMKWDEELLFGILKENIKNAETALITNENYLKMFGYNKVRSTSKELWYHIIAEIKLNPETTSILEKIQSNGTLATRILKALESDFSKSNIINVYQRLSDCLGNNEIFIP